MRLGALRTNWCVHYCEEKCWKIQFLHVFGILVEKKLYGIGQSLYISVESPNLTVNQIQFSLFSYNVIPIL